jgi:hypothetical protein
MTEPTMRERIARALWPWMRYGIPDADKLLTWDQVNKGSLAHEVTMDAARAVLAEMETPTEKMHDGARDWSYQKYGKPIGIEASDGCWRAMIAEARK